MEKKRKLQPNEIAKRGIGEKGSTNSKNIEFCNIPFLFGNRYLSIDPYQRRSGKRELDITPSLILVTTST